MNRAAESDWTGDDAYHEAIANAASMKFTKEFLKKVSNKLKKWGIK